MLSQFNPDVFQSFRDSLPHLAAEESQNYTVNQNVGRFFLRVVRFELWADNGHGWMHKDIVNKWLERVTSVDLAYFLSAGEEHRAGASIGEAKF